MSAINENPHSKMTTLQFIGQAGYIIESSQGQRLGIDLYLSDCVEELEGHIGYKRLIPTVINPQEANLDVLIATHPHLDHFDIDAIPTIMLNRRTHLYASLRCKKYVVEEHIDENRVEYVKSGDTITQGDYKLLFVDCDHGDAAPDAVGVIIEVDGKKICEVGDTCLHFDWISEYLQLGNLDVLIAPINGAYGNLNEEDCASLAVAINPKLIVPCHFGMFADHGGNPGRFLQIMKNKNFEKKVLLMTPGERTEI